jgi:ribosome-binding ATPase YchF (GTP1/OBG family)
VKIGIFGIDGLSQGKINVIDSRLEALQQMFNSPKKVYIQVDTVIDKEKLPESDGIVCPEGAKLDLILNDMEFVETRLARSSEESEKKLFARFKEQLDNEAFLSELALSDEEKKMISGYSLLSIKPVYLAKPEELENKDALFFAAYYHLGYQSFFTAGEKDAHAWSIKKGANAWEASGSIHSDIQKGFIRAEVVSYRDLINDGSLSKARAGNHVRLEMKEYIVQDGDYIVFRCNK